MSASRGTPAPVLLFGGWKRRVVMSCHAASRLLSTLLAVGICADEEQRAFSRSRPRHAATHQRVRGLFIHLPTASSRGPLPVASVSPFDARQRPSRSSHDRVDAHFSPGSRIFLDRFARIGPGLGDLIERKKNDGSHGGSERLKYAPTVFRQLHIKLGRHAVMRYYFPRRGARERIPWTIDGCVSGDRACK